MLEDVLVITEDGDLLGHAGAGRRTARRTAPPRRGAATAWRGTRRTSAAGFEVTLTGRDLGSVAGVSRREVRSPVQDYLEKIVDACGGTAGDVAAYIPELAAADPDRFALALATVDGHVYSVGDADVRYSIQSISKPFTYALALSEIGRAHV